MGLNFYHYQGFQHKRPWDNTYAHRRMQNLKYCISYKIVCQEWPIFTLHSMLERIWIKGSYLSQWLPQDESRLPKESKSQYVPQKNDRWTLQEKQLHTFQLYIGTLMYIFSYIYGSIKLASLSLFLSSLPLAVFATYSSSSHSLLAQEYSPRRVFMLLVGFTIAWSQFWSLEYSNKTYLMTLNLTCSHLCSWD